MEKWKDVKGFEGFYQVSDCGRIKRISGRILKGHDTGKGYLQVGLCRDGKSVRKSIHRLVLQAFVGSPPTDKHQCNHLDGNKSNNHLDNLEWVTQSENIRHAVDTGLRTAWSNAKLTPETVRMLREVYALGEHTQAQIGLMFGITQIAVSTIVRGKRWKDIGGPITERGRGWQRTGVG